MSIQNLDSLIKAREKQMGKKMINNKPEIENNKESELLEIIGLMFEYSKQKFSKLSSDIDEIKDQQKRILEILNKE